jgi:hypothetical protein
MKRVRIALMLCLTILGLAALAASQDTKSQDSKTQDSKSKAAGPITGTWQCNAHGGPNGDMGFTLYLSQDDESVSGSVSSPLGDTDIATASFKDGKLEIHINGGDTNYVLTAKLTNGDLTGGEWSSDGGEKGTWEGKKGTDQQGK